MSYISTIHRHTPSLKRSFKLSQKTHTCCSLWVPGSASKEWSSRIEVRMEQAARCGIRSFHTKFPEFQGANSSLVCTPQYKPELTSSLNVFKQLLPPWPQLESRSGWLQFYPSLFSDCIFHLLLCLPLQFQLCETYFRKSRFWKEERIKEERREGGKEGKKEERKGKRKKAKRKNLLAHLYWWNIFW